LRGYFNLMQGIGGSLRLWMPDRYVYIRSSWIESMNWKGLLWSVPDEMLMYLAMGGMVYILDSSTHRKGKLERIFCPTLKAMLKMVWLEKESKGVMIEHLLKAYDALKGSLDRKYKVWKPLAKDLDDIRLYGSTFQISRECCQDEIFNQLMKKEVV